MTSYCLYDGSDVTAPLLTQEDGLSGLLQDLPDDQALRVYWSNNADGIHH